MLTFLIKFQVYSFTHVW